MALTNGEHWVSPTIKKSDLCFPLSIDEKIRIFEDRVMGWQLAIGLECIKNVQHGGFGALYITLSYFELFERYRIGSIDHKKAGAKFRAGFSNFAKSVGYDANSDFPTVRDLLYEGARCGLYHMGMTSKRIFIEGTQTDIFDYDASGSRLVVNPELLISKMIDHFKVYTASLRVHTNIALRANFEKKFNHDISPQLA